MAPRPPADLARALHREVVREVARCARARAGFLADEDAESLHRLRVALRRLRALARLSRPFLRRPKGITEREFRRLGQDLAPLRDGDVTLDALRAAATLGDADERELLGAALDQRLARRGPQLKRVRRALRARPATKLFAALEEWAAHPRPTRAGKTPVPGGVRALARGVAERLLADRAWERPVEERGADPAHHRLRRRVRRARYQLECVAAMLGTDAPRTLGWLVEVQDALGRVQDLGAVGDALRTTKRGRAAAGAGCMAEWRERQRGRGAAEWDRLRAGRVAWKRRVAGAFD